MNRYEIKFYNPNIGGNSSVVVFAESVVLAVYVFVDNRYGFEKNILSIIRKDKAV